MRHKKVKLIAVLLLGIGLTGLQAQETVPASGGDAYGTGGTVSYSVGQIVYTTNANSNGSVAQGVQQPFEISIVTSIEEASSVSLQCLAYPNPTTDYLNLKIDASTSLLMRSMSYQLYDILGTLLETKKIESNETIIVTSHLSRATYFLRVNEGNKEVKTFKIIKN